MYAFALDILTAKTNLSTVFLFNIDSNNDRIGPVERLIR